jgi:WXXGXW repeat (2 copies)
MKIKSILCVSALALSAGFMVPMSQAQAQGYVNVQIGQPPPPRREMVPAPRRGYQWAPGYWRWNGRRHDWVGGTWIKARPGYRYVPPSWARGPRGDWQMAPSRWAR